MVTSKIGLPSSSPFSAALISALGNFFLIASVTMRGRSLGLISSSAAGVAGFATLLAVSPGLTLSSAARANTADNAITNATATKLRIFVPMLTLHYGKELKHK